jgi:site-specific recombinase XerD
MASVRAYLAASSSANTRRAYTADWADFSRWCETVNATALPAQPLTAARYLAHLADAGLKASTIERRAAAIRFGHKAKGEEPPTNSEAVKAVMRGIRRTIGTAPERKAPATVETIDSMLRALVRGVPKPGRAMPRCLGEDVARLQALRDRAIILVAFAAALRRSELVALELEDVTWHKLGIVLRIRRSKTDQEAAGKSIPVPEGKKLRPVRALKAWLKAAGIASGPLFRPIDRHGHVGADALTDRSVARVIKAAAAAAGLDPRTFSGHSPRAGFITEALDHGVDPFRVMNISGHKRVDTLRIYDRRKRGFTQHAGKRFL